MMGDEVQWGRSGDELSNPDGRYGSLKNPTNVAQKAVSFINQLVCLR